MSNVTIIPAKIDKRTAMPIHKVKKRRVAGYARVSTDHEEQASSYEAQVDYYTAYINSRDDWEFVGIYTDEGISATNTKKREGFRTMISDALEGKIDLIITKSVSRFARNTVDSLTTVRQLKDAGIEIYFEKENIWTLDSKGELLITIMSSLAQEESRSISENVTWGHRKRFADGKVSFAYSNFLGLDYDWDNKKLVVNEEQAEVVRLIFRLFLEGLTPHAIAKDLTRRGIKSPMGKDIWRQGTVDRILRNEKYKGDALLQKQVTVDFLQKKVKKNEGEAPQYYVKDNHEAIIEPEIFDMVQVELEKRKNSTHRYSGVSIFSSKIKCGDCGAYYGSKVWHSNDKYRRVIYRCNNKYKGCTCQTPHVTEEEVKEAFIKALNELLDGKDEILANVQLIKRTLCNTTDLEKQKNALEQELDVIVDMTKNTISENAKVAQDQSDYQERYEGLVQRYDSVKESLDKIVSQIADRKARAASFTEFSKELKKRDGVVAEFDERLWGSLVECVTIGRKKEMVFRFRDGTEITIQG
ncbi:MAG: recombinase family protein [Mogibacterium sp.]|nr:recombinase family protein [Mogibacterium sp.]